MTRKLRSLKTVAIVASLFLAGTMYSCDDEPGEVGSGLLEPGQTVNMRESAEGDFNPNASYHLQEAIKIDEAAPIRLGSYDDPIYGITTADFGAQFRLPMKYEFTDNPIADSIIVYLDYKNFEGDTIDYHNLKVYEIVKDLNPDLNYYSDVDIQSFIGSEVIGQKTFKAQQDTAETATTFKMQTLKIKLDQSIAERLVNLDDSHYESNEAFLQQFKGLYFQVEKTSDEGSLIRLNENIVEGNARQDTPPYVELYYHNDVDTASVGFVLSSNSATISRFRHDYSSTNLETNLGNENNPYMLYIQPMGGTWAKVEIPELDEWVGVDDKEIFQATVTFNIDLQESDFFNKKRNIPRTLQLQYLDDNGEPQLIDDYRLNQNYFTGPYAVQTELDSEGELDTIGATYTFNITHHLQRMMSLKDKIRLENNGFCLSIPNPSSAYDGVVLKGADTEDGIDFKVFWTDK